MYYINYDEQTGAILGIYTSSVEFDYVPSPKIAITDEEYNRLGEGYYIVQDGQLVLGTPSDVGDLPDTTEETQIATLQSEYLERLSRLKRAYTAALIMEEADLMNEISNDYRALLAKFTGKVRTIEEGDSSSVSTTAYCVMCGTPTENGICPKCHWRQ